ncbi:glycerol kinase [Polymorphobacter multimanifer]|uniref:glycerol kinase n=1 Tax=Polymorphobacter multimanifer TaxID=1070431 RepID=A0A841LGS0_9SPHN|nr:glycerol kinase GlpK [Polymorphobacter multimanifer]MBB6228392.1 glycerol kinase [Polymorphobacter multimanifer]GGI75664.1 glycerol kinase [Polymorphobacter multimanifer]
MNADLILVLDAGTTSTRAIAFSLEGAIIASAARPLTQGYPAPGQVEHDAGEIWRLSRDCLLEVADSVGAPRIAAIGITNQRETVVLWDKASGQPLCPAIVWQDRRTADVCAALKAEGHEPAVQATTGLLLDPYFSATKLRWAIDHWPEVAEAHAAGQLLAGTVESWLIWKLSAGTCHITDATNASRTLLMELATARWSDEMLDLFWVPAEILPEIVDCAGPLASTQLLGQRVPITGSAGDQHAASIGQACLAPGEIKATYGTGCFVLAHAGAAVPASTHRLLATLAFRLDGVNAYALEGSIFVAGAAVQWLRDGLGLIGSAAETEALARSVPDSGGVTFVPALAGLGAPHWSPGARGLITGLSGGTTKAHLARATLEAMGQQTADLTDALRADGVAVTALRVDGGMVANDWLCQDLADSLGVPVQRPAVIETTAMGAAMLAAVGAGLFADLATAAAAMVKPDRSFSPQATDDERSARRAAWARAVRLTLDA